MVWWGKHYGWIEGSRCKLARLRLRFLMMIGKDGNLKYWNATIPKPMRMSEENRQELFDTFGYNRFSFKLGSRRKGPADSV